MRSQRISPMNLLNWFGVPDLWFGDANDADWVYYFDHQNARRCRSEWYFHFREGRLRDAGFNRRGINDFSRYLSGKVFPRNN